MKKEDLKILFLGTPDFAVESLRRICDDGFNVVGVVTMPDKPARRGHHLIQSPVKEFALSRGLKVLQPVSLKNPEFIEELRSLDADLFVVIAFRMLPEIVWSMPRFGTFNLHASLLPRYRGAAPINRAVMNGDDTTGVTTFFLKHEIDTGDIIDREEIAIGPDENVGSVHDRLMMLGADLTIRTLNAILSGSVTTTPQDDLSTDGYPTAAPKIFREDCMIDWTKGAQQVHNHIRGLSPYPGAWTVLNDGETTIDQLKIFKAAPVDAEVEGPAGKMIISDDKRHIYVATGNGAIEILELQLPGKSRLTADAFLRGRSFYQPVLG